MANYRELPLEKWTEDHVSSWLKSIGTKDEHIQTLHKEEVTGPVLKEVDEAFLSRYGMKKGQIALLLKKRKPLLSMEYNVGTSTEETYGMLPLEEWTESHVSSWLKSLGVKEAYVTRLSDEEVTGYVLKELDEAFLSQCGLKGGQIDLILKKRVDVMSNSVYQSSGATSKDTIPKCTNSSVDETKGQITGIRDLDSSSRKNISTNILKPVTQSQIKPAEHGFQKDALHALHFKPKSKPVSPQPISTSILSSAEDSTDPSRAETQRLGPTKEYSNKTTSVPGTVNTSMTPSTLERSLFRPFDKEEPEFRYVLNTVLQPETGIKDLLTPCHEYKSFVKAALLDRTRLQAKFANELIKFSAACMNVRTNGTIHFGVMDSIENKDYEHGQIIGIPVKEKDMYVDALDYIEKCFSITDCSEARQCIRPPKFIEVIGKNGTENTFVIEVDVVPAAKVLKDNVYKVKLPNFSEKTNKVEYIKKTYYQRLGAKTESVLEDNIVDFIKQDRITRRSEAEMLAHKYVPEKQENLGRKLTLLLTRGKKYMDKLLWYILVTNKCKEEDLQNITFLLHMKYFCVFDFDPDSSTSGLCNWYQNHHIASPYFLQSFANESGRSTGELIKCLKLFDHTSWIFCNGRNDFLGNEKPCDKETWIKTKKKYLKKAVSFICNEVLPKKSFVVLFLLLSPVEQPIVDTFHEFYADLSGIDNIICIAESEENYRHWASFAQTSCSLEQINQKSIVGMKLSHIDATFQEFQPLSNSITRNLAVYSGGLCSLKTVDEEKMSSLEILAVNQCDDTDIALLGEEDIKNTEQYFYQGGKVSWKHFWFADNRHCEELIQRDAYNEVKGILDWILNGKSPMQSVAKINIYHHPGSGGSTVARHILWNYRKELRCALVKSSCLNTNICGDAVKLREYEEKDIAHCLPVFLLIEDCEEELLDELSHELTIAMDCMKIYPQKSCFILMSCRRSSDPEKHCLAFPLQTVAVTHKLSPDEKRLFALKRERLKEQFELEFILTFVLLSDEFQEKYVTDFVQHLLQDIDHSSLATRLIRYVALLNCYVQNSYLSVSHCEAFLGINIERYHQKHKKCSNIYNFQNSLSEQARLLFIHLRDPTTYLSSVRIIHPLVASEILKQFPETQSKIAMCLLQEKVLFEHRFGKDEFIKFIRDLFIRRSRKIRGDNADSFFSPLIEHVCKVEKSPEKAMKLLKTAYECLGKDPFFAQQLARLYYTYEKFAEAKCWAEVARSHLPHDSFILDTEGQVYRKWFNCKFDSVDKRDLNVDKVTEMIELALKAMECFRASEEAAKLDQDNMSNSAYFSEVDVGCRLLDLLYSLKIFSVNSDTFSEFQRYMLTDYIPKQVRLPWQSFHEQLKGLHKTIYDALESISEDLSYFQTYTADEDDGHAQSSRSKEHVYNPLAWLTKKTSTYARFFVYNSTSECDQLAKFSAQGFTGTRMKIYWLGGGCFTTILSMLSEQKPERIQGRLEEIICLYPKDPKTQILTPTELVNFILCHIALACVAPISPKLLSFKKLRELSKRFVKKRNTYSATAYFLLALLYWPDENEDIKPIPENDTILNSALKNLKHLHDIKIKNIPLRKQRIYTHFFLRRGNGLQKFVHKCELEKLIDGPLHDTRMKWMRGEVWKMPQVCEKLKHVDGWTDNRKLYIHSHSKKSIIEILPVNRASVPHGNENVTFYLGFSFQGLVAYDVEIKSKK